MRGELDWRVLAGKFTPSLRLRKIATHRHSGKHIEYSSSFVKTYERSINCVV